MITSIEIDSLTVVLDDSFIVGLYKLVRSFNHVPDGLCHICDLNKKHRVAKISLCIRLLPPYLRIGIDPDSFMCKVKVDDPDTYRYFKEIDLSLYLTRYLINGNIQYKFKYQRQ